MSIPYSVNRIGDVMVIMLASSVLDRWCEPKKNPKTMKLEFAYSSSLSMHYLVLKAKTGLLNIRIMCPSKATCLLADLFQ